MTDEVGSTFPTCAARAGRSGPPAWCCLKPTAHATRTVRARSPPTPPEGYGANGIVFTILARLQLFAEASFKFRALQDKQLFSNEDLAILENPLARRHDR